MKFDLNSGLKQIPSIILSIPFSAHLDVTGVAGPVIGVDGLYIFYKYDKDTITAGEYTCI